MGLIDRVEILTGGASAAYGSDALAGVINFILKDDVVGWDFNFGTQLTDRGDGEMTNFNITNGGKFAGGKGKYLAHFDILDRSSVKYKDRSFSSFEFVDGVDADGQHVLLIALDALVALDLVLGLGGGGDVRRHLEIAGVFCLCSVFPPVTRELFCLRAGSGFSLRAD